MTAVTTWRSRGAAPYLLHLRPAEWPVVGIHAAVGWWLATGWEWPTSRAWIGIACWVILLNGGTLALNSAFDHDQGDIAFLRSPPPPPRALGAVAIALVVLGAIITWHFPAGYRRWYLICAVLAILYSVPPLRLKSVPGADWVVNLLGFGIFTPLAIWGISGRPLDGVFPAVLWAFAPLFGALYPLTQLYQLDQDRQRGDRTLALRLGPKGSLSLSVFCAGMAFGMLAMAGWLSHWHGSDLRRWGPLLVAALAWIAVLAPWYRHARQWSSAQHQRAMYHALAAWLLTDCAVLLAWAVR